MITNYEAEILMHTSRNGRFVTGDKRVLEMGARGLLYDFGPQAIAGGDHCLVMTPKSRELLNEWKSAQPKPAKSKRRCSEAFRKWRDYCEAFGDLPFSSFWKKVWPNYPYR